MRIRRGRHPITTEPPPPGQFSAEDDLALWWYAGECGEPIPACWDCGVKAETFIEYIPKRRAGVAVGFPSCRVCVSETVLYIYKLWRSGVMSGPTA